MERLYAVIVALPEDQYPNGPYYGRLDVNGRSQWKDKRTAFRHAREFRGMHLRDAWVQEV